MTTCTTRRTTRRRIADATAARILDAARKVAAGLFPSDPDDAAECGQLTTLRVLRDVARKGLTIGSDLEGVSIRRACRSVASHMRRAVATRAKYVAEWPDDLFDPATDAAGPAEEAERNETVAAVRAALAACPAGLADVLFRTLGRGESLGVAGAAVGVGRAKLARLRDAGADAFIAAWLKAKQPTD